MTCEFDNTIKMHLGWRLAAAANHACIMELVAHLCPLIAEVLPLV